MATTLTSKGQVTIPKKIRDYLKLRAGSAVRFVLGPDGEVTVQPADRSDARHRKGRFDGLRGTLGTGQNTDELMQLLRDYKADVQDPGLK